MRASASLFRGFLRLIPRWRLRPYRAIVHGITNTRRMWRLGGARQTAGGRAFYAGQTLPPGRSLHATMRRRVDFREGASHHGAA